MENFASAELKLVSELTKAEKAIEFVNNANKIAELKKALKQLEARNEEIETILIPEIGLKYQPKGSEFVLTVKTSLGRSVPSYKDVVERIQKVFNFSEKDKNIVNIIIEESKGTPKDKQSIVISQ